MSMDDGALLTISPDALLLAVGPQNPNMTSIVRRFVDALSNNDRDQSAAGVSGDRAARRRLNHRVLHPTPTAVGFSDLVSPFFIKLFKINNEETIRLPRWMSHFQLSRY